MELVINGERRQTPDLETVADLAIWLGLPAFGSAVELNGVVVRRAEHATTPSDPATAWRLSGSWGAAEATSLNGEAVRPGA